MQFIDTLKRFLKDIFIVKMLLEVVLIKILSCLQEMKKGFNKVISAGYVINYLM